MEVDFVTYQISEKLKAKGFREKCFATYTSYSETLKLNEINTDKIPANYKLNIEEFRECYNYYESAIDAPTISQVLKWLRKEKKIYVTVNVEYEDWFEYKIVQSIKNTRCTGNRVYNTYEDAILAGIEYVINNLI